MAKYSIERTEFVPHPMGPSEGIIYDVADKGSMETTFGIKRKVSIKVQSLDHMMEDGRPFSVQKMMNISAHEASDLYKFRCAILQVGALTDEQAYSFDDSELLGKRIGDVCEHQVSQKNGQIYAHISTSVWPLTDQTKGEAILEAQSKEVIGGQAPDTAGAAQNKDLPF